MKTLTVTGHRPYKLGGYQNWPTFQKLIEFAMKQIAYTNANVVLSGMAQGWDLAVAIATIRLRDEEHLNIRLGCVVPFSSQYTVWPDKKSVFLWTKALTKADEVFVLQQGTPNNKVQASSWLDERNQVMIDQADEVLALWNGSRGGTANAVEYAREIARPVINCWNAWKIYNPVLV